jgi:S-adenosylmethionine:tRNA ribosyltransferase-isomerase
MVGNASSWPHNLILEKKIADKHVIKAKLLAREADYFLIQLSWIPEDISFAELLHIAGLIPLPPYIKRQPELSDAERYQTVYAYHSGSVAAPTAGLHFTPEVMEKLSDRQIEKDFVTLHVGAGTFKPVKSDTMKEHEMHSEFIEVKKALIEKILNNPNRHVIAVGTTSLRTLESLYWIGAKLVKNENLSAEDLQIQQWEPYDNPTRLSLASSFNAILKWMENNGTEVMITKTSLLIAPGYSFRVVSILITNFHQSRSTLLLLVAAFIGEEWKTVYTYAIANDFRFLSYGDSCLFFRH